MAMCYGIQGSRSIWFSSYSRTIIFCYHTRVRVQLDVQQLIGNYDSSPIIETNPRI